MSYRLYELIYDYEVNLLSVNLKNELYKIGKGQNKIGIGIAVDFPDMIKNENIYVVPTHITVVVSKDEIEKDIDLDEKDVLVKISSIYTVELRFTNDIDGLDIDSIKDYAFFLAEHKINQDINSLGLSIGLPNLITPRKKFLHKNDSK